MNKMQLIAGRASGELGEKLSKLLKVTLTPVEIKNFANGEVYVRVDNKVRGDDVFVVQTLGAPANDNLMELLILVDALRRASAGRINLICPMLCYSRQDRKTVSREPITAKLVANLITKAGADRVVTVDLHVEQIQGFYDIPFDHFVGYPIFAKYLKEHKYKNMVIVSPDIGGVKRANKLADLLGLPLAIIDKIRKEHNKVAEVTHVVGEVEGKTAVVLEDIIDTGGSMVAVSEVLKKYGAKKVIICATHALMSGKAKENLEDCPAEKVLVLDTVPVAKEKRFEKLEILSIAPLMAKVIKRIHKDMSLGELFTWEDRRRTL